MHRIKWLLTFLWGAAYASLLWAAFVFPSPPTATFLFFSSVGMAMLAFLYLVNNWDIP